MRSFCIIAAIAECAIRCNFYVLAANEEPEATGEDSSAGLPEQYAKDPECIKDVIVALQPFTVLGELPTKYPYFQNESHGGVSAEWSDKSSVAMITLDGKWGPHDVFLLEFRDGKLARTANILAKAHDLLLPSYRKSKAEPYNDNFDFIFDGEEGPVFKLDGTNGVIIDGDAVTDPKGISRRRWTAHLKAVWSIPEAKFTSRNVVNE